MARVKIDEMDRKEKHGMDMNEEGGDHEGKTVLNSMDYPELQGAEEGQSVEGRFTGKVEKVEGEAVTIAYETVELTTLNKADREMERMTGKKMSGKPEQATMGQEMEEDYK